MMVTLIGWKSSMNYGQFPFVMVQYKQKRIGCQ